MMFDFDGWKALTKRERGETLRDPIGKALALIARGMPTFGRWPSAGRTEAEQKLAIKQMQEIALTYAVACANQWQITPEIVKATAQAYLEGEVSIFKDGAHIKPEAFPDVNQFRDACLQTFYRTYCYIITGTRRDENGYEFDSLKLVRVDSIPQKAPALEAPITKAELERARQTITKVLGRAPAIQQEASS